jgi:hypothetical protein
MRSASPQSSFRGGGSPSSRAAPAQLTAGDLLELCEQIYDTFNAAQHTLDTHLHNSLQQLQHKLTDDELCFIQEVGVLATGAGTTYCTVGTSIVQVQLLAIYIWLTQAILWTTKLAAAFVRHCFWEGAPGCGGTCWCQAVVLTSSQHTCQAHATACQQRAVPRDLGHQQSQA